MPGTIAGLAVLAIAVTPGFVFLAWREAREPARHFSALRETAAVLSASLTALVLSAAVLSIVRAAWPHSTPDIGQFVRQGEPYLRAHYVSFIAWGGIGLALACGFATVGALAWGPAQEAIATSWLGKRVSSIGDPIRHESGWAASFHRLPESIVFVGIELTDGTYLYGRLDSFSPQVDETADRSIVLCEPVDLRRPHESDLTRLHAKEAIVNAAQMRMVTTYYLHPSLVAEAPT